MTLDGITHATVRSLLRAALTCSIKRSLRRHGGWSFDDASWVSR